MIETAITEEQAFALVLLEFEKCYDPVPIARTDQGGPAAGPLANVAGPECHHLVGAADPQD